MTDALKLPASALKIKIDLSDFDYLADTAIPSTQILGQARAQAALQFGVAIQNPGYNIYVMGEPGTGRLSMVTNHLDIAAENQQTPVAYAYVDNFDNPREPVAIQLPPGQGAPFFKDIEILIDNLLATFPGAFESPTYQQKKTAIERSFNQRYNTAIDLVEKKALSMNVSLFRDNEGITFAPIKDGKPIDDEQFSLLAQQDREIFHEHVEQLEDYLGDVLLELPQWRREMVEKIKGLDNNTIQQAIDPLFKELGDKYSNVDDVTSYLTQIKKHLHNTGVDLLLKPPSLEAQDNSGRRHLLAEQYLPNILVDYKQNSGAPVIYEPHPIFQNLFGRIEYSSEQGTLITSYRRICPGSLHRANGGYIVLDAEKLLTYPLVWEGLKRALKSRRLEIESPYTELGVNTITLKPEVIPLNVKIILVGSREIYYLLQELDVEFNEMFHILADFDNDIKRTKESMHQFAALMKKRAKADGIESLSLAAIESLLEHSCRMAENQHRLSARINDCLEIIGEANLLRQQAAAASIEKQHIKQALAAREQRNGRIAENILEEMLEDTILIDTEGSAIGKINGLTILAIGDSSFGAPVRISATVYPGNRGIVDIEKEAELGQAIHTKGVMILTGYLGNCYAQQFPLSISASIAIEQSYGQIDGDSASLGELCALISALTRTPIKQNFAITGSINQYGEVQAVGGINEKIEGFFRLCSGRPSKTAHAVIIPRSNKRNLMLKQEVIEAVEQDRFAIYAVSSVDEALELLTGLPAGNIDAKGNYPAHSLNFKAVSRLQEISEISADQEDKKIES
jgi:lon-related putative ATP-dependent protease